MRGKIGAYEALDEVLGLLAGDGLFLVTGEKGNPMTIGWGSVGVIWGRPVFTVLVRPSRHSFSLIEALPEFTVNVPKREHRKALAICGSKSGRDDDKITACGFSLGESESVKVPYLNECTMHYECRVIHHNDVISANLDPEIARGSYPSGDLHCLYYGEILGVYREV